MNYKIYIWTLQNYKYFIWLYSKNFSATQNMYVLKIIIFCILFPFFFPIISVLIPNYDDLLYLEGASILVPLALHRDKNDLTKKMQSKLFWYKTFKNNNILTPEIYYYYNSESKRLQKINELPYNINTFIIKPEYGTEGSNIIKADYNTYTKLLSNTKQNLILQEYVLDCYYKFARHFRINTLFNNNNVSIFYIDERKQTSLKIASNHANGGIIRNCGDINCDFLSEEEQEQIIIISDKLKKLHIKELNIIPFIGWDVCLTCNGPYVFEGNLGASMTSNKLIYQKYISIMTEIYNTYK